MIKQATKTRKSKVQDVLIVARYFIKRNGHVVSIVLSSNGVDTYQVVTIDGVARSCTCPARKPCKHLRAVQIAEENRPKKAVIVPTIPVSEVVEHIDDGLDAAIHEYLNVYESLPRKVLTQSAYGCCGHIVHLADDGQLCGACLCK